MALARIRTNFPDEIGELTEALVQAGYVVETIHPSEFRIAPADLELTVDKLPVVDAWRHVPDAEVVYVAPDTPESRDVRSAFEGEISHEPLSARVIVGVSEYYLAASSWTARHTRELRARWYDLRQRWTPPREYRTPIHLEPEVPANLEHHEEARIDVAIEEAFLRQEDMRRRQESEMRQQAEEARLAEENRRRMREAAEAEALLEEQQKIEAMVRATEMLRERVAATGLPAPRSANRQRPRPWLRTRRERAFVTAGVAAFALSLGLALLAGQALHPRPALIVVPQAASSATVPFAKPQTSQPQNPLAKAPPPGVVAPQAATQAETTTASLAPANAKPSAGRNNSIIDDDEVIVRKPARVQSRPAKVKNSIAHYSDLD